MFFNLTTAIFFQTFFVRTLQRCVPSELLKLLFFTFQTSYELEHYLTQDLATSLLEKTVRTSLHSNSQRATKPSQLS